VCVRVCVCARVCVCIVAGLKTQKESGISYQCLVTLKIPALLHEIPCSLVLIKYYAGDQIKNDEIGEACGTYGRQERCIQGFGWKT